MFIWLLKEFLSVLKIGLDSLFSSCTYLFAFERFKINVNYPTILFSSLFCSINLTWIYLFHLQSPNMSRNTQNGCTMDRLRALRTEINGSCISHSWNCENAEVMHFFETFFATALSQVPRVCLCIEFHCGLRGERWTRPGIGWTI